MEEGVELKSVDSPFEVCLGKAVTRIGYHEKLNVIFVGNENCELLVIDPTLGDVLYFAEPEENVDASSWDFNVGLEKMVLVSKGKVGIRSEYNGIILASSILQTPISSSSSTEQLQIELTRIEAEGLSQTFASMENAFDSNSADVEMVKSQLRSLLSKDGGQDKALLSVKKDKWATVKLNLPHSTLKSTFQALVQELWKKTTYIPQLSIASSILDRLTMLNVPETSDTEPPLDRALMFSETARLATFANWPHMDYKWALPEKMAQAGFYHNPSTSSQDDRALCFACNVCLVSWEPTDEPWSEHERHSPFCAYVRGEHTHNVPLFLSNATAPAVTIGGTRNLGSPILGTSSLPNGVVVGYSEGLVVVFDISRQVKQVGQFEVVAQDFDVVEPRIRPGYCDVDLKPKDASVVDILDSPKIIVDTKSLVNLHAEESLTITALSLLGCPLKPLNEIGGCDSPSVIVGATLERRGRLNEEKPTTTTVPVIFVYGLIAGSFARQEDSNKSDTTPEFKGGGTRGTIQETQSYEEDVYGSLMSESDIMSDSISIFSDLNMSDSSGTFVMDPSSTSHHHPASIMSVMSNSTLTNKKKPVQPKASETVKRKPSVTAGPPAKIIQNLLLPNEILHCSSVQNIHSTSDGSHVIVFVVCKEGELLSPSVLGAILVYRVKSDENVLTLEPQHLAMQKFEDKDLMPVNLSVFTTELMASSLACVLANGEVHILSLPDLSVLSTVKSSPSDRILTATYCSSLERLCCGTSSGRIKFYAIGSQTDSDFGDDKTEQMNMGEEVNEESPWVGTVPISVKLTAPELQSLLNLTKFENITPSFTVNAPSCWIKIIQAQQERKHPQHLQHHDGEVNSSVLSWRLQRNRNSKKEHLFEITLPKSTYVGHLDMKFLLQMGCVTLPHIEATLYRVGKKKSDSNEAELNNAMDLPLKPKTSTTDFLKSINAKVVCGPLDLRTHVDLSAQGGTLVMTSPSLILTKGRNFYLHIRAKSYGKSESSADLPTSVPSKHGKGKGGREESKGSGVAPSPKQPKILKESKSDNRPVYLSQQSKSAGSEFDKKKEWSGCDWLHEISISLRQVKMTEFPSDLLRRKSILTCRPFLMELINTVVFESGECSYAAQSSGLELLVWIAAVNLCGPQMKKCSYQLNFLKAVQSKLNPLILQCILLADRSTAHKCSRLFVLCIDSLETYQGKEDCGSFVSTLLTTLLALLPRTIACKSAGSLQWFFLLLNRIRNHDLSATSETLLTLLNEVSHELNKRNDPVHSVLRTRFGLYGSPFESELFELELPPVTKSYSHPLTYAGLCGTGYDGGGVTGGSGVFHLWGLKDVDFRDLLIGNPLSIRGGKIGLLAPKQQIQGLLEVEPLHFTCHAASDGTRIEKIDLGISTTPSSAVPLPQPWEPFTNMPTGEGSKKSDPDKMEQIMMLQKAFKLEQGETYFDVLSDLKFMESGAGGNMIDMPFHQVSNDGSIIHHLSSLPMDPMTWKNASYSFNPSVEPMSPGLGPSPFDHPSFKHFPLPGSSTAKPKAEPKMIHPVEKVENEGLRLLLSPWQQMMYAPPQQVLVIDRMHSGARRFVVLDFGAPILLTDMVVPSCNDLVSLSIDLWVQREEVDGQRLVVASDIGVRSLVICDLQPPALCRYLKITVIGRYGMGTTKCRIPIGMFYGHTTILQNDLRALPASIPQEITPLTPANIQGHLSVLSYLVEDIACRYHLACTKLKRLLEPLMKPEMASLDHVAYYLPKGKERNRLGLNSSCDQTILSSYNECLTLQQQLNVAKNVVRRLQMSLASQPDFFDARNPLELLPEVCTDKVHVLSEFLIESLLGISFLASSSSIHPKSPLSLYSNMSQSMCEGLFRNICVLENGQCQLSLCTLLLRVCGFQPWWGKFLTSSVKQLFSCTNSSIFPQDRVFILLVYLGQKSLLNGQNSSVLESALELLQELLSTEGEQSGFLRSKIDMTLLGWVVMYLGFCLDGVNCTLTSGFGVIAESDGSGTKTSRKSSKSKDPLGSQVKDVKYISSRWDFIQGESALYRNLNPQKANGSGGLKRRIQKKILATKQKLEELDTVAAGLGFANSIPQAAGLGTQLTALGNKIEAIKQKQASLGKASKQTSKANSIQQFKDLLQMRRSEMMLKRGFAGVNRLKDEALVPTEIDINLSLNSTLCLDVAKGLGSLILRMDSTSQGDLLLVLMSLLARIATACRPAINLATVFNSEQCVRLMLIAVGTDYVQQTNWSTSWMSHGVMCLIEDLLEGEKMFPEEAKSEYIVEPSVASTSESNTSARESSGISTIEESNLDYFTSPEEISVGGGNEIIGGFDSSAPMDGIVIASDESDVEGLVDGYYDEADARQQVTSNKPSSTSIKRLTPCMTCISSALDTRLEIGVESTTELRLRMMSVVDSEVLTQSFTAPIEVPPEFLKTSSSSRNLSNVPSIVPSSPSTESSYHILAKSFDQIFLMMASENCSVSVGKALQMWISVNNEGMSGTDSNNVVPIVPLASESTNALMTALMRNTGIGVHEWGLGFQCLTLAANQAPASGGTHSWVEILTSQNLPQVITRFISGSGMNLQKSNMILVGPTASQHFYNFLLRLHQLSSDTPWTYYLKEILLRVLGKFLAGPFLNGDFPIDAFNKFLDRVVSPDLSYENPATVVSIIERFAQILHLFVFFPNKLTLRSNTDLRGSLTSSETKVGDMYTLEHLMFRLALLISSMVSLPYKTESPLDDQSKSLLSNMGLYVDLLNYQEIISGCVSKCDNVPKTIGDLVLHMEPTMMRILSVLSKPNGMQASVRSDVFSALSSTDSTLPTSLFGATTQLFRKLCCSASQVRWTVYPVFNFLSKSAVDDFCCPLIVSEAFVLLAPQVIDHGHNLKEFCKLNGVETLCEKFVSSTRQFFSSCPTFISILTQYIGKTDSNAIFGQKKVNGESIELQDGLMNMAPLGTISSNNFSAHPSEVLLQAAAHRTHRARSPIWTYNFLPEENFLELIVTLPCAVLLKEIQVVPHVSSLSMSCPSAITVEISRNLNNTVPLGYPVQCGGMSNINIQLVQPEVTQSVLLRLFKPKDSNTIGLSQIRLLGSTTFSESALQGLSPNDPRPNLESSVHWLYMLDRIISAARDDIALERHIMETALKTSGLLEATYAILMAPASNGKVQELYLPQVSSILFRFGCLRKDMSEQLISALLGPVQSGFSHGSLTSSNMEASGCLTQLNTVVELIYKLCCEIPDWGYENLLTLLRWLGYCADNAVRNPNNSTVILPEYVHAIAASLWTLNSNGVADLSEATTASYLKKLVTWTKHLDAKSELKASLDLVLCSLCYCKPWLYFSLLIDLGILGYKDPEENMRSEDNPLSTWYESERIWEKVILKDQTELRTHLEPGVLMTIARAAQSREAAKILQDSKLLVGLNAIIMDFWSYYSSLWANGTQELQEKSPTVASVHSIIAILDFMGELCRVNQFKNWLGHQGSVFWLPILNLLSSLPGNVKSSFFGVHVFDFESSVINFLTKCCWSHLENQKIVSSCICEIIIKQKATPHKAVFLHSISSFCRRLLIQLLLENEKTIVHIRSESKIPFKSPEAALPLRNRHPSMGVKGGDRIFFCSLHSLVSDVIKAIDPTPGGNEKLPIPLKDTNRIIAQLRKEQGMIEAGLEMIDNMHDVMASLCPKEPVPADLKRPLKTPSKRLKADSTTENSSGSNGDPPPTMLLEYEEFTKGPIATNLTLSGVLAAARRQNASAFMDHLVFTARIEGLPKDADECFFPKPEKTKSSEDRDTESKVKKSVPLVLDVPPVPSTVEVFSRLGGLGLLAKHLPVVYPETLRQIAVGSKFTGAYGVVMNSGKESPLPPSDDWVKVENADDFYEEMIDSMMTSTNPLPKKHGGVRQMSSLAGIPPHSMAAFGLFLSLPKFPEVLLGERQGAQCMLRLVMGVKDDADGNDIFGSPGAKALPVLPFQVLRCLLDALPLSSEDGRSLRNAMVELNAIHFILACLAVFTHQKCDPSLIPGLQHELVIAAAKAQGGYSDKTGKSDDKSHVYWAKGTGFGTGSTAQSWDIELAMEKKKAEEENVTCLLLVLSSFLNPNNSVGTNTEGTGESREPALPTGVFDLLKNSCILPAIAGYLRNDSVLDMSRHVPLYKSILQFLRALVSNPRILELLAPWEREVSTGAGKGKDDDSIAYHLSKMKEVVDSYSRRLTSNTKKSNLKSKANGKTGDELEDEGLALLIPDIQTTATLVERAVADMVQKHGPSGVSSGEEGTTSLAPVRKSLQERYLDEMRKHQFAFHEMIVEEEESGGIRFTVSHHYEGNVRASWSRSFPARLKRLAQENVTLSTSLPIAYGSTIFVRCDTDRLDVMKVLITGPEATPYANGCFEFDVYFPNDYPTSPMMINLETNGRQRVRFNPNLYTDGKVCLSILNTWHGRPEEKWNPQTSSLLPVLVAIQSLILNAEPYFNEPGYEKSRGTEAGEKNSREYNAGIQIATVEWAMLEQIRRPSPCFKDIIHRHFWLKQSEITQQCEQWLEELTETCKHDKRAGKNMAGNQDPVTVFKNNWAQLKKELGSLKTPEGLEDMEELIRNKKAEEDPQSSGSGTKTAGNRSGSKSALNVVEEEVNVEDDEVKVNQVGGSTFLL